MAKSGLCLCGCGGRKRGGKRAFRRKYIPGHRANFQLRFDLTNPALPEGIVLRFGVPLTFFRNNTGTGGGFQGGISTDAEPLTRKLLADFLLAENPSLTETTAGQIVDDLFKQGFHVSIFARLRSQNVGDSAVSNPNVAFFAELGSQRNP